MLLVDDVPEIRRLVAIAIRLRGGIEVVGEAGDGSSAVEVASRTQPDVVVLDLGLPGLRDRELLVALRHAAPKAKVAVFTGLAGEGEPLRGQVEGYVPKDHDVSALLDLLEDLGGADQQVAVLDLPHLPDSVRPAREYLRYHAERWGYEGDLYEAELVVDELVENAVAHGAPPLSLRIAHSAGALLVEVADGAPGAPEISGPDVERGWRGMAYVSLLAQAWGVMPRDGGGKSVWTRLTRGTTAPGRTTG